jgi:hypothetical protein
MSEVELRAAETLLDKGVPVSMRAPLLLRLFGKKRITATIHNPTAWTLIQINRYYLLMGVRVEDITSAEFYDIVSKQVQHTKTVSKLVATALLNGRILQKFFTGVLAWWLIDALSLRAMCTATKVLVLQGGIEDFTDIIALGQTLNMLSPKTSQPTEHTS